MARRLRTFSPRRTRVYPSPFRACIFALESIDLITIAAENELFRYAIAIYKPSSIDANSTSCPYSFVYTLHYVVVRRNARIRVKWLKVFFFSFKYDSKADFKILLRYSETRANFCAVVYIFGNDYCAI